MRGGAKISCYVNAVTGHELEHRDRHLSTGERIAVIGAGPAGLSYASIMGDNSEVKVFEKSSVAGGALRYAGKAPRFQEVDAVESTIMAFIIDMQKSCREKGVDFKFGTDVTRHPGLLEGFDRIVVATGADYRFGLGRLTTFMLDQGFGHAALVKKLFESEYVRNAFYYKMRRGRGLRLANRIKAALPNVEIAVIGDANRAGKGKTAIKESFDLAYHVSSKGSAAPGKA